MGAQHEVSRETYGELIQLLTKGTELGGVNNLPADSQEKIASLILEKCSALVDRAMRKFRGVFVSAQADDLAQRATIAAYMHLDQLETPAAVGGWLQTICGRVVSSQATRESRTPSSPTLGQAIDPFDTQFVSESGDPAQLFSRKAERQLAAYALGTAPVKGRAIIDTHLVDGQTERQAVADLAAREGIQLPRGSAHHTWENAVRDAASALNHFEKFRFKFSLRPDWKKYNPFLEG